MRSKSIAIAKKILFQLSTLCIIMVYTSFAEESVELQPLVITDIFCSQDSISPGEKGELTYFSVPSILEKRTLTDTRTRGPYGVQTDISLRGAPFEQNMVMIDGISINDPKSGHHNMDLPLAVFDVEKIDITYGSGALGGTVNIVPKEPEDRFGVSAYSTIGSRDFYSGGTSLSLPLKPFKTRSSVEWKRSTGYAPEREFSTLTASSRAKADFGRAEVDIFTGYLTKKFGAADFYSSTYPDEEESINTGLLIAKGKWKEEDVSIAPAFYLKRLQDKFILDRNRPAFSRNDHTTYLYGGEIASQVKTPLGEAAFGAAVGSEEISSTNLGGHSRVKTSAFMEYEKRISKFFVNLAGRFDGYSTFSPQFSPSVNAGFDISPHFTVRSGVVRAFRAPTFTDLYYRSAANIGNNSLEPETAWTYDVGIDFAVRGLSASGSVFLRNTEDAIDWTREAPTGPWQAENIGEFDMLGLETSLALDFPKLTVKYSYLEGLDKKGITSKYYLEYLKHNLALHLEYGLPYEISHHADFIFRKRAGQDGYFLMDSGIYKDVEFENIKATLFIKLNNIFDTNYTGQDNAEMPGFAAFAGARAQF